MGGLVQEDVTIDAGVACPLRDTIDQFSSQNSVLDKVLRTDIISVWDRGCANLFAWLDPEDFDFLSSSAGDVVLRAWMSALDILLPPSEHLIELEPLTEQYSCVTRV